jgi:hypothetical protein
MTRGRAVTLAIFGGECQPIGSGRGEAPDDDADEIAIPAEIP